MKENRRQAILDMLSRRQPDLTVFMDQVHKPHNLAAIVRTCDAIGVGEVHAVRAEGVVRQHGGTAMGSNQWVKTNVYTDFPSGLKAVKDQGMQVLAAHLSDTTVDFREIDYTRPTCIVVGAEKYGVSEQAAEMSDHHILIPMLGMVQSLNVSVATALILYEAQRQRQIAGMYEQMKLKDSTVERLLFNWLQPQVKSFCDKNKLRYPKLNEFGDVDDPEWDELRKKI